MTTAIAKTEQHTALQTPMGLLQLAIEREGSIDVIERLAKLQTEMMDREARTAYIGAFEEFKRNAPRIVKDSAIVVNQQERGRYAKLDQVCNKLVPALLAVGITHRWKTGMADDGKIIVTCYLRHRLGHEEQGSTIGAPSDTSGSKNAVQAVGSTVSYLERYTLVASCGIAIEGQDATDAPQKATIDTLAEQDQVAFLDNIRGSNNKAELQKCYLAAVKAAEDKGDGASIRAFINAKDERLRQL